MRFVWLLAVIFLGGCAREASQPLPSAPKTGPQAASVPRDDLGREVALKTPARRVVCIGPGATETIFALGAGAKLVGRDQFSNYPPAALKVPIAGDYTGPFIEKAIAARPDLVIIQGETYDKTRAENWQRKIGAPVAILAPKSVDEVEAGIKKIASWLGARDKLATITKDFPSQLKPPGYRHARAWSVFYEVQRAPLWTAGEGTLIDSQLRILGWRNVAREVKGYKPFNIEVLLQRDPDFYIVAQETPDGAKATDQAKAIRELQRTPRLKSLTAVKKGRVIVVDGDLVLRPGPRLPQGLKALSTGLSQLAERDRSEPGVLKP